MHLKDRKAFTLIEFIIVIALVAILAAAIFVAVDPGRRLHESRNAERWTDITTISNAVVKYKEDNEGNHYSTVGNLAAEEFRVIGTCTSDARKTCTAEITGDVCVDLSEIGSKYLSVIPVDPVTGTDENSDYYLGIDPNGDVVVGACDPEGEGAGGSGAAPNIELVK
ncbi:prepilin-type N-terminal cleavage/methylation domain-containing protein [Patescibacteria group bacterium]